MRRPKYWSFSFSIIPSKEHSGLISFRMDWLSRLVSRTKCSTPGATGISGLHSKVTRGCVWNPRVFADDARGWQCPFVLCLHPQGCLRRGWGCALPSPNAPGKAPNHIHTTLRWGRAPGKPSLRPRELRAFFSCMAWRAIPGPLSKLHRRLDSL